MGDRPFGLCAGVFSLSAEGDSEMGWAGASWRNCYFWFVCKVFEVLSISHSDDSEVNAASSCVV